MFDFLPEHYGIEEIRCEAELLLMRFFCNAVNWQLLAIVLLESLLEKVHVHA
jgi:hypothetical protein